MNPQLKTLLHAAQLAPSGDNTQPWRFLVQEDNNEIALLLDPARDPSPMNAGQHMAHLALGAALENIFHTARFNGWPLEEKAPHSEELTRVRLTMPNQESGTLPSELSQRVTNRRGYLGTPLSEKQIAFLKEQSTPLEGISTIWVTQRTALDLLGDIIARADQHMFTLPAMRQAFLSKVRLDLAPGVEAEDGLPVNSLELSFADRLALRLLPWLPQSMLVMMGALKSFSAKARQLLAGAAGLCLILAPDQKVETNLLVGRAFQKAWLALTTQGLASQPMMSLPVLDNVLRNYPLSGHWQKWSETAHNLLNQASEQIPLPARTRLAAVMRFGQAEAPSGRAGRLPLDKLTVLSSTRSEPLGTRP